MIFFVKLHRNIVNIHRCKWFLDKYNPEPLSDVLMPKDKLLPSYKRFISWLTN